MLFGRIVELSCGCCGCFVALSWCVVVTHNCTCMCWSFMYACTHTIHRTLAQIKLHPFFKGVDWVGLARTKAAFVPALEHDTDTSYFVHKPVSQMSMALDIDSRSDDGCPTPNSMAPPSTHSMRRLPRGFGRHVCRVCMGNHMCCCVWCNTRCTCVVHALYMMHTLVTVPGRRSCECGQRGQHRQHGVGSRRGQRAGGWAEGSQRDRQRAGHGGRGRCCGRYDGGVDSCMMMYVA